MNAMAEATIRKTEEKDLVLDIELWNLHDSGTGDDRRFLKPGIKKLG
jgi:hypothetical protein